MKFYNEEQINDYKNLFHNLYNNDKNGLFFLIIIKSRKLEWSNFLRTSPVKIIIINQSLSLDWISSYLIKRDSCVTNVKNSNQMNRF